MHQIFKTTLLTTKIFKIMKTYQIVTKGVVTNKICLYEFSSYSDYLEQLEFIEKKCNFLQILITNIY